VSVTTLHGTIVDLQPWTKAKPYAVLRVLLDGHQHHLEGATSIRVEPADLMAALHEHGGPENGQRCTLVVQPYNSTLARYRAVRVPQWDSSDAP